MTHVITPNAVDLPQLERLYRVTEPVGLDPSAWDAIEHSAAIVARAAMGDQAIYGINTGFGKLASVKIAPHDTEQLQRNIVLSHCCGVGDPLDGPTTRLMMVLKLLSLGRGASGVRPVVCQTLIDMMNAGILPVIPSQGSVGASGDLAPLAHMAAAMMGQANVTVQGKTQPAAQALAHAGITPLTLSAKEGLALLNGTQFSTALALVGLFDAWRLVRTSLVVSALSTDAIMGSTAPLHPMIHELRGHRGQSDVAQAMRDLLDHSVIRNSHIDGDTRVQDPYCIRCQPQVTGAAVDLIRFAAHTLMTEANAVTDNPLVLRDSGEIVSGGNFHAEPVGFAADQIAMALSEIGSIAQRRVALMVDPTLSHDLPAFLTPNPGLNSGYMIAEVTTAALMSENKHLAHPCTIDSTPTSANQEDHVSMAAHGARRLMRMIENLSHILGIEAMCAIQGIEARAPLTTSPRLLACVERFRQTVPALGDDRYLADDIAQAARLMRADSLGQTSGLEFDL